MALFLVLWVFCLFLLCFNSHFSLVVLAISFEEVKIILYSLVKTWLILNTSKHWKLPCPASLDLHSATHRSKLEQKITLEDLTQAANIYWHGHIAKLSAFCVFTPI